MINKARKTSEKKKRSMEMCVIIEDIEGSFEHGEKKATRCSYVM